MKKFINAVNTILTESLDGFVAAHGDILMLGDEHKFVRRRDLKPGKVGIISGGGSGHEPLHAGFVGHGMLDAACPGQVFTSPTPDQMLAAAQAVNTGAGILFVVKNYEGDVMNFDMAAEMAADMGVEVATVTTNRMPAPAFTAWAAASIWSGVGEVNTWPGQAASSMPCPTNPAWSGSWPEPPPEIIPTLPGLTLRRRTNLCSSPSATISPCAATKPSRLSARIVSTALMSFFTDAPLGARCVAAITVCSQ